MRPHRSDPKDDPGRVRLLLATELGWLQGYPGEPSPGGLPWRLLPIGAAPSVLQIDGERLHQANWALRQIYRDHLAVLASILEEPPERWRARTLALLELLTGPAREGAPLPSPWCDALWEPRLRARAATLPKELHPLTQALGWRWVGRPGPARALLALLEESPEPWSRLLARPGGLAHAMLLLTWITEDRAERVLPTLALLQPPTDGIRAWRGHQATATALLAHLDTQSEAADYPQIPAEDWSAILDNVLLGLSSLPRAQRRRGLAALALLRPPVAENVAWWQRFTELEAAVAQLPEHRGPKRDKKDPPERWRSVVRGRLIKHQKECPPPWHPRLVGEAALAVARSAGVGPILLDALPLLSEIRSTDAVASFLVDWTGEGEQPRRVRHVQRWAQSLRAAVRTKRLKTWILPWTDALARWSDQAKSHKAGSLWLGLTDPSETLEEGPEPAVGRFYAWLDDTVRLCTTREARTMAQVFGLTDDPALAARVLQAHGTAWMSDAELSALVRLARWWPIERTRALSDVGEAELTAMARALDWLGPQVDPRRLAQLEQDQVRELGWALQLLDLSGQAPTLQSLDADTAWTLDYPAELQPTLVDLARWRPDAEPWTRRAMDALCPPDEALDQEIAAIQARLQAPDGDTPMHRRITNLRKRRAQGRTPSASQVRKLHERAQSAADKAFAERQLSALRAQMSASLLRDLGVTQTPPWFAEPEHWRAIGALGLISKSIRKLALRVLRHRAGQAPWDLRDEPANRRFIEQLTARGVDLAPWLGERSAEVALPNGEPITLSLEADPLEILQMGAHFRTCLSPGEMNFYSAVVNAADINKRVIYARSANRRVVGRALLALTDAGQVLTYEPYCHRPELGFAARVHAFAEELAQEMGTVLTSDGAPRALMAGRWYDDGARDLFDATQLAPNSPLAQSLETLSPDELLPTLRAAIRPAPLDGAALTRMLALPVIQRRTELLLKLVPEILASKVVSPVNRVCTAAALFRGGERGQAQRLLPSLRKGEIGALCCGYRGWIDELVALDPWFILKILRLRGEHYFDGHDAFANGRALEAVGRPVQALERYRQAVAQSGPSAEPWTADAEARIARLQSRAAVRP